jgi:FHS family L-fucose permease-like MFS transporter
MLAGARFALLVPALGYVVAWTFPVYVNFGNRRVMDSHRETLVNVERPAGKDLELEKGEEQRVEEVR